MGRYRIRDMEAGDLPGVMEIERENFTSPWSEQSYRGWLSRPEGLFLVALDGEERVAGYCGAILVPEDADITSVAVRKDLQGQGLATELVARLAARAAEGGCSRIFLEVRETNLPAIRVYEKNGFEQVGIRKNYYSRPTEHALLMRREEKRCSAKNLT